MLWRVLAATVGRYPGACAEGVAQFVPPRDGTTCTTYHSDALDRTWPLASPSSTLVLSLVMRVLLVRPGHHQDGGANRAVGGRSCSRQLSGELKATLIFPAHRTHVQLGAGVRAVERGERRGQPREGDGGSVQLRTLLG